MQYFTRNCHCTEHQISTSLLDQNWSFHIIFLLLFFPIINFWRNISFYITFYPPKLTKTFIFAVPSSKYIILDWKENPKNPPNQMNPNSAALKKRGKQWISGCVLWHFVFYYTKYVIKEKEIFEDFKYRRSVLNRI